MVAMALSLQIKLKSKFKQLADWGLRSFYLYVWQKHNTPYLIIQLLLGAPKGFTITVSDIRVANGAGFIVCRYR